MWAGANLRIGSAPPFCISIYHGGHLTHQHLLYAKGTISNTSLYCLTGPDASVDWIKDGDPEKLFKMTGWVLV